jgi:hypothetical protein
MNAFTHFSTYSVNAPLPRDLGVVVGHKPDTYGRKGNNNSKIGGG